MRVEITESDRKDKKMKAVFYDGDKKIKTTHFGAKGMSDYTIHKDIERKQRYLDRHKKNEDWNDYQSAGSLAFHILWSKPTLQASIKDYKKKFNLD